MPTWIGPTTTGAAWRGSTPPAAALFRHYGTVVQGTNYYIRSDGSVTSTVPTSVEWEAGSITRVLFGAHCEPVTAVEQALIATAGLSVYVHDGDYSDTYDDVYRDTEAC